MPFSRVPPDDPPRAPGPPPDPHDEHLADLSAYVLGGLESQQSDTVARHLAGCPVCQAELPLLQESATMLEAVPPEAFLDGPPDNADLLVRRVLRQLREQDAAEDEEPEPRRAPSRWLAVAAALVVLTGVGGLALGRTTAPSTQAGTVTVTVSPTPSVVAGTKLASATDPATNARLTAKVVPAKGWVRVTAAASGIAAGQRCHLVVVAKDGTRTEAGSWLVSETGAEQGTTLDGAALVAPDQVGSVAVVTDAGQVLVSAPVA
jgi:anti-sigma factor RsiW